MIKSYDAEGRVYCLFDKKTTKRQDALDIARKNLKIKGSLLTVSCAQFDTTVHGNDIYDVGLKSGVFWCVSKCAK